MGNAAMRMSEEQVVVVVVVADYEAANPLFEEACAHCASATTGSKCECIL